jgi:hypothetical protein
MLAYLLPAMSQTANKMSQTADDRMVFTWTLETGGVLTKPVQKQIARLQAEQFSKEAVAKGFQTDQINTIAAAINKSTVKSTQGGFVGIPGYYIARDSAPDIVIRSPEQAGYLEDLFSTRNVALFIKKFATVRLEVNPVPPRDYNVTINDEDCGAGTEKGVYHVLPGSVGVNVTRRGKPPCAWKGNIAEGKEQLVSCNL